MGLIYRTRMLEGQGYGVDKSLNDISNDGVARSIKHWASFMEIVAGEGEVDPV